MSLSPGFTSQLCHIRCKVVSTVYMVLINCTCIEYSFFFFPLFCFLYFFSSLFCMCCLSLTPFPRLSSFDLCFDFLLLRFFFCLGVVLFRFAFLLHLSTLNPLAVHLYINVRLSHWSMLLYIHYQHLCTSTDYYYIKNAEKNVIVKEAFTLFARYGVLGKMSLVLSVNFLKVDL